MWGNWGTLWIILWLVDHPLSITKSWLPIFPGIYPPIGVTGMHGQVWNPLPSPYKANYDDHHETIVKLGDKESNDSKGFKVICSDCHFEQDNW